MPVSIGIESPLQTEIYAMIDALNAHLIPLSPLEFQYKMTAQELAGPENIVFVAREAPVKAAGKAIAMGTLKVHPANVGEVKRMFTYPKMRGQRVASQILQAIRHQAQTLKLERLVVETGIGEGYAQAWRLYENFGFSRCGPVLDYADTGHSAFFEMGLSARAGMFI